MRKKFYRYLLGISFLTLFLSTIASMFVYYSVYVARSNKDLDNTLFAIENTLDKYGEDTELLEKISKGRKDIRITLIKENGEVVFDSSENPKFMPTHSDRPEVIKAKETGFAQVVRYSTTLSKDLYYVSRELDNGDIIRIAREMDNLVGAFVKVLPIDLVFSVLIFLIGSIISRSVTKKTFDPLNNLDEDLTNIDVLKFPELSPFITKINKQNNVIKDNLKELKREKDTIETILRNMKEALIIIDENKNLLSVNNSAKKLFDARRNFIGESVLNLIRDEDLIKLIENALSGESEETISDINDRKLKTYVNPVFEDNRVKGVVLLFIDETEEIRALKMREEFSSNVSHELKTPLTSICGFSELLVNGMVDDDNRKEFYKLIYNDSKRLLTLIEDIMKISEFDSDVSFSREEIDLNRLMKDLIKAEENIIEEKDIKVSLSGDGKIFENKTMMWELFGNIINNGIKYNKDGGSLSIDIEDMIDKVKVEIRDTGIGISNEDLNRIFERFYRVDKSRSRKVGGTGLGLSIVKHIIKSIDGDLEISSKVDVGTKFKIILEKNRQENKDNKISWFLV